MEALMTLNFNCYSMNIIDIVKIFQQIGWNIYNSNGKVEYLPLGDSDDYDWQCEEMSEVKLYNIISKKIANKECVGVNLFYNNGVEGVSLIAYATDQIMLSIELNHYRLKPVGSVSC